MNNKNSQDAVFFSSVFGLLWLFIPYICELVSVFLKQEEISLAAASPLSPSSLPLCVPLGLTFAFSFLVTSFFFLSAQGVGVIIEVYQPE